MIKSTGRYDDGYVKRNLYVTCGMKKQKWENKKRETWEKMCKSKRYLHNTYFSLITFSNTKIFNLENYF